MPNNLNFYSDFQTLFYGSVHRVRRYASVFRGVATITYSVYLTQTLLSWLPVPSTVARAFFGNIALFCFAIHCDPEALLFLNSSFLLYSVSFFIFRGVDSILNPEGAGRSVTGKICPPWFKNYKFLASSWWPRGRRVRNWHL